MSEEREFAFSEYIKRQYDEKERSDIESMATYIPLDKVPYEAGWNDGQAEAIKMLVNQANTIIDRDRQIQEMQKQFDLYKRGHTVIIEMYKTQIADLKLRIAIP